MAKKKCFLFFGIDFFKLVQYVGMTATAIKKKRKRKEHEVIVVVVWGVIDVCDDGNGSSSTHGQG